MPNCRATFAVLPLLLAACQATHDAKLDQARALLEGGQPARAIPLLRQVVASEPAHPTANLLLGQVLLQTGQASPAVPALERALGQEQTAVPAGLLLASAHLLAGRHERSLATVDRVLAVDPDHAAALRIRATAHLQLGQAERALADADRILSLTPDDDQGQILRATALQHLGRTDQAAATLEDLESRTAAAGGPAHARACTARASFLAGSASEPATARPHWDDCVARHPTDPGVIQQATLFYDQTGDPERSVEVLENAAAALPEAIGPPYSLAQRLATLGRADEGDRVLLAAAGRIDDASAWASLAMYRQSSGDPEGALTALERALDVAEAAELPPLRLQQANLWIDLGRLEPAEAVQRELAGSPAGDTLGGRLHLARGDAPAALAAFDRVLLANPGDVGALFLAGLAAQRAGDVDRALAAWQEAARIDASATDADLHAAQLHQRLGEPAAALDAIRRHRTHRGSHARQSILLETQALIGVEDPEAALALADAWQGHQPGDVAALLVAAEAEAALNGPGAAARRIEGAARAIPLAQPVAFPALQALTAYHVAAGNPDRAAAAVDAALTARPTAPELLALRAGVRATSGDAAGAETALRAALEAAPGNRTLAITLASLLARSDAGNAEALELLRAASAAGPLDREAALLLVRLADSAGDPDLAIQALTALVAAQPLDAVACNDLAWHLAAQGRELDRALALARRAVRVRPGAPQQDTLARVHLARGEAGQALEAADRALALEPGQPSYLYGRGLALRVAGRPEEAREAFQAALAGGPFAEEEGARAQLSALAAPAGN